ncbi:hypothetical protein ABFS82_02G071300 [Erythranthe guttata]|uniref:putative F-box/FBD/LRR-repeat protein At1g78760 isoform X2 n=1 Tax=Erythranthe guttata TaxID=4155 RepID=UPI00064D9E9D|nr:PREDICTED: putative F-box/FBD/LRR-repeat protein At1g78760 isoform X2 [Erythranthe guttata]|eukprot:XP_012850474.1 PREDICTED: putative F-box/FBD/LRR-repeat protein At1g78760 isoform X2 [Erythranthe guttata]
MADRSGKPRKRSRECRSSSSSSSKELLVIGDADRLSRLPQEIQSDILCLLPITDAAKVGLLSKTWRSTWLSLPKLAFDYRTFPEMEKKVKFIDQTLARHSKSSVKTFELHLVPLIKIAWMKFATRHNVEKLVLYGEIKKNKYLPDCIFTCRSLVKLDLALHGHVLTFPETVSLPNLRKLKLKHLVLYEPELSQDPFSIFPALEKLSIFHCTIHYTEILSVSSLRLIHFTMGSCLRNQSCSVRLRAPSLSKFIYISDDLEPPVELEIPPHAFQLVINSENAYTRSNSTYDVGRSVIKATRDLLKCKAVELSHWFIEYLYMARDLWRQTPFALLHDLVILDTSLWPTNEHIKTLMVLLSRCPNLTKLSVRIAPSQREALQLPNVEFLVDFDTGVDFRCLDDVCIKNFGGEAIERMLVRYLLANSSDLTLMTIFMNDVMANGMLSKISEILGYEKSSPYADVIFN